MKLTLIPFTALLAATFGLSIGSAQQAPTPPPAQGTPSAQGAPPPPNQPAYSRQGTIKAFNSGPNGETNGLILSDGTVVLFAPEIAEQFRSSVKEGSRVTFSGMNRPGVAGRMVVDAQTITANGQKFTSPVAPPQSPRAQGGRGPAPAPAPAGGPRTTAAGSPPPPPPPGPPNGQ